MSIPLRKFLPGIAWFLIILVLICIPGKNLPQNELFNILDVDKWIHVGIFGTLVVLFGRVVNGSSFSINKRRNYFLLITFSSGIYGVTTELIQKFYIPGRSFDRWDIVADCLGALIGLLYCRKKFLNK